MGTSDELSSFLRQILSPPHDTANGAQFDRSFSSVYGGGVSSYSGDVVTEVGENKRSGGRQRNSLKRNIDAQFHNLSEKRRRSKINEKMKALQKLIPNSNKTDKASMLDEAIEYLKQLQLQVQTLAVMNGLGLNPMRLPPVLPPTHTRIINETLEPELNIETLFSGGSHSLVRREPPEASQEMGFPRATLL